MMKKFCFITLLLFATGTLNVLNSYVPERVYQAQINVEGLGNMVIMLYNDTPNHRDNFIKLVNEGFYNETLFHRVIPWFMAQGGDPSSKTATAEQGLGRDNCPLLPNEIKPNRFHKKGALSAARLPDASNPEKKSSGCQFFVVQGYKQTDEQITAQERNKKTQYTPFQKAWYKAIGGSPFLDGDYTVFGEVIDGIELVDLICAVPTNQTANLKDRPLQDIRMTIKMLN